MVEQEKKKLDLETLCEELAKLTPIVQEIAQELKWGDIHIQVQNKKVTMVKPTLTFRY